MRKSLIAASASKHDLGFARRPSCHIGNGLVVHGDEPCSPVLALLKLQLQLLGQLVSARGVRGDPLGEAPSHSRNVEGDGTPWLWY